MIRRSFVIGRRQILTGAQLKRIAGLRNRRPNTWCTELTSPSSGSRPGSGRGRVSRVAPNRLSRHADGAASTADCIPARSELSLLGPSRLADTQLPVLAVQFGFRRNRHSSKPSFIASTAWLISAMLAPFVSPPPSAMFARSSNPPTVSGSPSKHKAVVTDTGIVNVFGGSAGLITSSDVPTRPSGPGSAPCVMRMLQIFRLERLLSSRTLNDRVMVCPSRTFSHLPPAPVGMLSEVLHPPVNTPLPGGKVVGVEFAGSFLIMQPESPDTMVNEFAGKGLPTTTGPPDVSKASMI